MPKRYAKLSEQLPDKPLPMQQALAAVRLLATAKFDESIEVAIKLGVDSRKSDQNVRGTAAMPAGTGKTVRIGVLCQGKVLDEAKVAGADVVGSEDLLDQISKEVFDFDVLIATPDMMSQLGKHGKLLGPKGLMPNPKSGTVTADVTTAVKRAQAGEIRFRTDKGSIIHAAIGRASFTEDDLVANFKALIEALKRAKPPAAKGQYLQTASVAPTMGPAISVDLAEFR